MMKESLFQLSHVSGQPVSNAELLADLRRVAQLLGANTVPARQYTEHGHYSHTTISKRFNNSWNEALLAAGLRLSNEVDISDVRLFENLLTLWKHYGRQPRRKELARPPSMISQTPYNRFGGWTAALKAFVDYANSTEQEPPAAGPHGASASRHTTSRYPSLRLQWKVLKRDHYKCRACGRSPATTAGLELQVDHIIPWSKDGETVLENLQTLCSDHNLGKSNEHD